MGEELLRGTCDLNVKVDPVRFMIEIISCEHLIEETAQRPDI